jgi:hypothetical protein
LCKRLFDTYRGSVRQGPQPELTSRSEFLFLLRAECTQDRPISESAAALLVNPLQHEIHCPVELVRFQHFLRPRLLEHCDRCSFSLR